MQARDAWSERKETMRNQIAKITKASLLVAALLAFAATSPTRAASGNQGNAGIAPPQSHAYGKTYAEWSVAWWQWALGLPVAGHPFNDAPGFNVASGQTGEVWFLGAPFGTVQRACTIPTGKALFIGLLNSEWSSLEGYPTLADQSSTAELFGDHIVNPFCIVDGVAVKNLSAYRFSSPQFTFTAPSPWIFGDTGGTGTSVADGYYVLVEPLSAGQHTIRYGGSFHFAVAEGDGFDFDASLDMTYTITVK
jgi:hypothetical protein